MTTTTATVRAHLQARFYNYRAAYAWAKHVHQVKCPTGWDRLANALIAGGFTLDPQPEPAPVATEEPCLEPTPTPAPVEPTAPPLPVVDVPAIAREGFAPVHKRYQQRLAEMRKKRAVISSPPTQHTKPRVSHARSFNWRTPLVWLRRLELEARFTASELA